MNPAKTRHAGARLRFLTLPLLAAFGAGCAASDPGSSLRSAGFHHGRYPYVVSYADAKLARFLPEDWRLDNYKPFEDPSAARAAGSSSWAVALEPKEGQTLSAAIDRDDDGKVDERVEIPIFDLKFVHARTAGVIWLRTLPVSGNLREKELRILAQDYIDAVSGVGLTEAQIGPGKLLVQQRHFATRTVNIEPMTISGHEAFAATFEVANVDQLKLDPDARWERARVVLVRTPFGFFRGFWGEPQLPVFMAIGYENLPGDFDKQLPDFEGFLKQIVTMPDDIELQKVAAQVSACGGGGPTVVTIAIDDRGAVDEVAFAKVAIDVSTKVGSLDCLSNVLKKIHLHGTGQPRSIRFSFERR
jgi:hypothetical protein